MSRSRRATWAVPAVAVAAVAGVVGVTTLTAAASPEDLTPRSASELLTDLTAPTTDALSGTVVQTSRLGLPELPGAGATTGPASLATGSHTLRVWLDGEDRTRVALLGELAEYDVVRDGRDVWTYSSQLDEAVHYVLPEGAGREGAEREPAQVTSPTPAAAAEAVLAAVDPTTVVTVDEDVSVAGRSARQLVLEPRDTASLIGSVRLAVDAETNVPLRVQVFGTADEPAFEVGFTDVSFTAPDASVFAFSPPPGAEVREVEVPSGARAPQPGAVPSTGPLPTVVGEGWTSVLVLEGVEAPAALVPLTTAVPEGRLLSTALVSVLLTDDGRLLVGAVTPEALRAAS